MILVTYVFAVGKKNTSITVLFCTIHMQVYKVNFQIFTPKLHQMVMYIEICPGHLRVLY